VPTGIAYEMQATLRPPRASSSRSGPCLTDAEIRGDAHLLPVQSRMRTSSRDRDASTALVAAVWLIRNAPPPSPRGRRIERWADAVVSTEDTVGERVQLETALAAGRSIVVGVPAAPRSRRDRRAWRGARDQVDVHLPASMARKSSPEGGDGRYTLTVPMSRAEAYVFARVEDLSLVLLIGPKPVPSDRRRLRARCARRCSRTRRSRSRDPDPDPPHSREDAAARTSGSAIGPRACNLAHRLVRRGSRRSAWGLCAAAAISRPLMMTVALANAVRPRSREARGRTAWEARYRGTR
jgi:hypothetical protein